MYRHSHELQVLSLSSIRTAINESYDRKSMEIVIIVMEWKEIVILLSDMGND